MALSALPKALGLSDEFKKGFFPHMFNVNANQNYVGEIPAIEFYTPNAMKDEVRTEFLKWYENNKQTEFNFQEQIDHYCVQDVNILTQACLKFRDQMITTTNVCPFTEASTIASVCNKVFRRNFLKADTIGIIPKKGYRLTDNQSKIAIQWLLWEERQRNINIKHAAKDKEEIIFGSKVDGYCVEKGQIFEFYGCYYHGCPTCFKYNRDKPLYDNKFDTFNFRYETTQARTERLKIMGCEVLEKWECEFRNELKENPEIEKYTNNHSLLNRLPLNPRDCFFGGRTGNCQSYYVAKDGEQIKYIDICSLYPYICKYGKFPVGHPKVIVGKDCNNMDLKQTDGIIKCKILPPQDLYHPVLPLKLNNRLMFILCRTCGENMSCNECKHSVEERSLYGTWVMDEVLKAIEKGYKIMEIFEIWQYQVEKYDPEQKVGGLFVEMMNKFLKIKQEASGWPDSCTTTEQKNKYIDDFFEREGIQLEFESIVNNPGLRCLAKLMLNSFWGKLGQQENQPKTKIVNRPEEYFSLFTNTAIIINSVLPVNEDVMIVNYTFKDESYDQLSTVNVCLAAYTTAQARLKLYSYLDQLKDRVLYYDTDSIIYTQNKGEWVPPTGNFIGDMTDELACFGENSYITSFASGGPKNYAYKVYSTSAHEEKVIVKVKGICLNHSASKIVNFETIRNMILNPGLAPINIISKNIRRTKDFEVITKEESKIYRPNSQKRVFKDDFSSLPYGYKKQKFD